MHRAAILKEKCAVNTRLFILNVLITLACLPTLCAIRTPQSTPSTIPIIMVPVPLKSPTHEYPPGAIVNRPEKNEPNWFPHLISIFAHVGIIFLDPKNIFHVKQHVAKLLDNIQALVHEITKRTSPQERRIIIHQLSEQLQSLAAQLPEPIFIQEYEASDH